MDESPDGGASQLSNDLHVQATYRLTEALVESENRMRRRLELLTEVVFEADAQGLLVFLNPAWTTAAGRPVDQCLGKPLRAFIFDEDLPIYDQAIASGKATARPSLRLFRPDGAVVWVELSVTKLPGGGAVGALHDITLRKRTQEELSKLSLVASLTENLVIITDQHGRIEWVNQAFTRRTGYTNEEVYGSRPGDFLQGPGTDRHEVARIAGCLRDGVSCRADLLNYTKSGEPYWTALQITPVRDASGEVERFISVQTDATELRRTQDELEAAKIKAESANEAKTQFLATISHEMRTPLNVILGSAGLALEGEADLAELESHLNRIHNNSEILLRLISDMLDVSKIEAGQIDLDRTPFSLRPFLNQSLEPAAQHASAKGLPFRIHCDPFLPEQILDDPSRLRQIVNNLAENAVKFTEQGEVRVEASLFREEPGGAQFLEIRVIDSGEGVPEEARSRIFDRFEQADGSITRRKGGVGLGLNIVKSLTEAMGGTVALHSAPTGGAEFRVCLPLVPVQTQPESANPATMKSAEPPGAARPARILVAEDADDNFYLLNVYLTKAGYQVERAVNGRTACEAAMSRRFDLILMDVEMPEMDGLEATRRIRLDERANDLAPIPVFALTAHAVKEYRERCLAAGCTGYLSKPIRKATVLEAVAGALAPAVHMEP